MVLTRAASRAMAQQLVRVNAPDDPADVIRQLEEDLRTVTRQRDAFARRNSELVTENERLLGELAPVKHPTGELVHTSSSFTVDHRPVMTAAQAAHWAGVSVATVSRYIASGFWHATRQPGSNRWLIYTDAPLPVKRRK